MVLATITERGILSKNNCVSLDENINNTDFNAASGTAVSGTSSTITLESSGSYVGKVIELTSNTGENQARLITDVTGAVATVTPDWDIIPDSATKYIIHQHSGVCPEQTQNATKFCLLLSTDAPNIDNYYVGAYIKLLDGNGKNQIHEVLEYTGSSRKACVSPRFKIAPLENTLYAIYGEGGVADASATNTITLDGNQTSAVKVKQYIELISGTGVGQVRRITNISGNIITVEKNWDTLPDTNTRYSIFSGWCSSDGYENVLRQAVITVTSTIDVDSGERAILAIESSIDTQGIAEIRNLIEMSSIAPSTAHAITVISQFFRIKVIGMGTTLNGSIQTILNSYKSGKVTSKMEESIYAHSDCDLNRSVIAGKTPGGYYQNISADYSGNLSMNIKNPIDAFGSIAVTQPRQFVELMFLNNYINPAAAVSETINSATITVSNNIASLNSGTNAAGGASLYSIRRMRYNPGLAVTVRFATIFSPPINDSIQIIGYGDSCDGVFLGYNNLDFGILFRRGGKNEIRRLTITTVSTNNDTITITLNGVTSSNIAILSTDNIYQIARKIVAGGGFATLGSGWDAYEEGATILFVSRTAGSLSGSYSYTSSQDSAGTFASVQTGVSATDTWIKQRNWNIDRAIGNHDLPVLHPQKGNVYEISLQWLGFGNINIKMEHPEVGTFFNLHQIRYSNKNTITSLLNPNLPLYANVKKTGNNTTDSISLQTSSMGLFIMGDNNKILGPRLGIANCYSTTSGALTSGTYYNILSIRNMVTFNNLKNYNEVYILGLSIGFNSGSSITRGGIFTFFTQPILDNTSALTWTKRNQYVTSIEYCKDVVSITGGNELLSIPIIQNQSIMQQVTDLEMFIPPGTIVSCAFKPFNDLAITPLDQAAIISVSASWIQR